MKLTHFQQFQKPRCSGLMGYNNVRETYLLQDSVQHDRYFTAFNFVDTNMNRVMLEGVIIYYGGRIKSRIFVFACEPNMSRPAEHDDSFHLVFDQL